MATGHTHRVLDGEVTTLEEFAFECSRSFVWSFREGNELAYPTRNDDYYRENIPKELKRLEEWDAATEEQKYALWSEYATTVIDSGVKAKADAEANAERLRPLLAAVTAKHVPETHARFKEFMIQQLQDTLEFDGTYKSAYYTPVSYPVWADSQRAEILRSLSYYAERIAEEDKRHSESVAWISTLASLFNLEVKNAPAN